MPWDKVCVAFCYVEILIDEYGIFESLHVKLFHRRFANGNKRFERNLDEANMSDAISIIKICRTLFYC